MSIRRLLSRSRGSSQNAGYLPPIPEKSSPWPATASAPSAWGDPSSAWQDVTFNDETEDVDDGSSTANLMSPPVPLVPLTLKVKRVDYYFSKWYNMWKYKNTGSKVTADMVQNPAVAGGAWSAAANDPWKDFCFVVVRTLPQQEGMDTRFRVVIKSPYLLAACKHAIGTVPNIVWTAEPLELDPHVLLAFLPAFDAYHAELLSKKGRTTEEDRIAATIPILTNYLRKDYNASLTRMATLTSQGEITFNLLYFIFVPRSILLLECPSTGEPRAVRLVSVSEGLGSYTLMCESIDAVDDATLTTNHAGNDTWSTPAQTDTQVNDGKAFGWVSQRVIIPSFRGIKRIDSLDAYPLKFCPKEGEVRKRLVERGRKWADLRGVHHMQYSGTACWRDLFPDGGTKSHPYLVNSRIMIDRGNFVKLFPNSDLPKAVAHKPAPPPPPPPPANLGTVTPPYQYNPPPVIIDGAQIQTLRFTKRGAAAIQPEAEDMSEEELLLAPATLYGYSLGDKLWFEFNIEHVKPITWNDEAFQSLVLPPGRKTLLQSLVEAHNAKVGSRRRFTFDDFVPGKGRGLVINLFGPPGVGKTLSAEATSEHVKQPLYVIGAGDLGTKASDLEKSLEGVLSLAAEWKAIVLIDEADVFLERRSLHDMERNAMVAVFLRQVEYYSGIMFLTTNRVKTFDDAFLSRIHVALHFQELTKSAKKQIWVNFLSKAEADVDVDTFEEAELERLAEREVNGRQIKNATRTACSLAFSRGEKLSLAHLLETLDVMDEFTTEFQTMPQDGSA
ncbi:P-loop containing nucleoside triphosphate hydrolase protein [Cristinia sonorae]|uniref:P-loop containing nucleoside triphosphate hydrolase protein n=1 Tax=Cristinia sonorae TaxID=1940300 RepID=A0A8K0UVP7_9AGAR|nr:P-loop containing nucleoside triphosphate hydrolase protein [Cristinia sonorae]